MRLGALAAGIFIAGVIAGASACSALYAPDDGEFSGGSDGGRPGAPDGAKGSEDAPSSPPPADAAAPALVCPPSALVCDDFERDAVEGDGLALLDVIGAASIDRSAAHSPTRSLAAVLRRRASAAALARVIDGVPTRIRLSLWIYTPNPPPNPRINVRLSDFLWGNSCDWEFTWSLFLSENGLRVSSDTYDERTNPSCGPVDFDSKIVLAPDALYVDAWHHVVTTHDVIAKRSITSVDDGPPADLTVRATKTSVPTKARLSVGIPCVQTTQGCFEWDDTDYRVYVDDVTVTPAP